MTPAEQIRILREALEALIRIGDRKTSEWDAALATPTEGAPRRDCSKGHQWTCPDCGFGMGQTPAESSRPGSIEHKTPESSRVGKDET
jgi:rubrerythrin